MTLSAGERGYAREVIARRLGLDFPSDRADELERRLLRACRASSEPDAARFVSRLAALSDESPEWKRLVAHLTIGETYFFRDTGLMEALENEVIPSLVARRRREHNPRLRIWSAGCSTGEEPYSLAMLVDRVLPDRADWSVTILATDVSPASLSAARRATYREWSLRATPEPMRRRYFTPRSNGTLELARRIRKMVTFAPLNLVQDTYPSLATNTTAIDLVVCRNVIMYLTPGARRAALERMQRALIEGGWMALSPAEASVELLGPLENVPFPGAVLFRKAGPERAAPGAMTDATTLPAPARRASPAPRKVPRTPSPPPARKGAPEPAGETVTLLERARAEAGRGGLDEARALCREAIARERLDPAGYLLLAEVEQERGEVGAAVDAVRRAIYLDPDSSSAHFILGSLLIRDGQRAKGRRSMETVVRLLGSTPADDTVPGADGLTAGRLVETARGHLEAQ